MSLPSEGDYYKVLNIDKTATPDEINNAYRAMELKHLTNKQKNKDEFKKIYRAYKILSDAQKRQVYDELGEEGLKMFCRNEENIPGYVMKPWLMLPLLIPAILTCGCFCGGCCFLFGFQFCCNGCGLCEPEDNHEKYVNEIDSNEDTISVQPDNHFEADTSPIIQEI